MKELKFLDALINSLEHLPNVGKKTATRYAYYIVEKMSEEDVEEFATQLKKTKQNIKHCQICGILTNKETCEICNSELRDKSTIIVVKDSKDAFAIEGTNQYNGLYHILNGLISPMEGIGPDELNIASLEARLNNKNDLSEIILATPFTPSGETTALYLEKILKRDNISISRIGYGLPAGGDIEYVDELTLKRSLENRRKN